jgi:hypothetical protein
MTTAQAYQILNLSPGTSQREIEQAYRAALQTLQLQLVPGQPLAVRQQAQGRIAELKSAFELLKRTAAAGLQPAWAGRPTPPPAWPTTVPQAQPPAIPQIQPMGMPPSPPGAIPQMQPVAGFPLQPSGIPQVQPVTGFPVQPPGTMSNPSGQGPVTPTYPWIIPAGFALAAAVMLFVIVLCVGSAAPPERQETARLRVLSVPWSYVNVDGEPLGPSGQLEAFTLKPGEHEIVFRQGNRVLSRTVHLPQHSETVIKVQLEKGQIHVADKQI